MSRLAFVPHGAAARKPPHGAACNRCGVCCMATLCPLGQALFKGEAGPCPALVPTVDGYGCGVVADPARYRPARALSKGAGALRAAAALLIGSGTGCDARINGEPINEAFYDELRWWDAENRRAVTRAKKLWGIP